LRRAGIARRLALDFWYLKVVYWGLAASAWVVSRWPFAIVLINGARQTGKSTLVRTLEQDVRYFTFDDPAVLAAA
jgi:predicted AAA+ superfamily ATPase